MTASAPIAEIVAAWNAHDGARFSACFAEDGVYDDVSFGMQWKGRSRIAEQISVERAGFSRDARVDVSHAVGDDTGYAFEWRWTGTTNESGAHYDVHGASVGRVDNGLVIRHSDYWNPAHLMEQIAPKEEPTSNEASALAFLRAAFRPDYEECARLLGESYTLTDRALGRVFRTAEELQEATAEDAAWADRELDVERVLATTDGTVVVQATMTATHAGRWRGVPATGRRVVVPVCYLFGFDAAGGLIAEDKYEEHLTIATQLGLVQVPTT